MSEPTIVLHEARAGEGLPLVLVHGFPLDHRMWDRVVDALPAGTTVLTPDNPGFGASPLPAAEPGVEVVADALAAALDARGVARAVVAGMSMGGYVVLALLERRPDLVAGVGLVDTKSVADLPAARENRLRIAAEAEESGSVAPVLGMRETLLGATSRATRADLAAEVGAWIGAQDARAVAWAQRAMAARPDRTAVLAAYPGPVTVVVGVEDDLTPPDQAEHMVEAASASSEAALVLVPAAGHLAAAEEPEHVAGALARLHARA